jgi:alpha-L-rhamnosidase
MMKVLLTAVLLAARVSAIDITTVAAGTAQQIHTAVGLEVEHATEPLTVDTASPRFSWELSHPQRAQRQISFRVVVTKTTAVSSDDVLWDSGTVPSNATHVLYAGARALPSDTDFSWSVVWADATGAPSQPASSTFSTALLGGMPDWHGAEWLSSSGNGSLNLYRAVLPELGGEPPLRARLYIASLGYYHATLNGVETDRHILGPQSTFHVRALYDVWDVAGLLRGDCNTLGVALGNGWGNSTHSPTKWDRQFIAMLSVTAANGTTSRFPTTLNASAGLQFHAGPGPVTYDDIFDGEAYDGRVAATVRGWDGCRPPALVNQMWEPAVKPADSPADHQAEMSSHVLHTIILRDYSAATAGGVEQPVPGVFVFNFAQNMAGIVTLRVRDCLRGSVIRLRFGEILWGENQTVHNQFPGGDRPGGMARMLSNYTCAGAGEEVYRTQFSSFGFQFVQVEGYPGVPMPDALTAHFIGPDFAPAAEFTSSSGVLNRIQSSIVASAAANWANDVPTDCPHRERRGYLGDGQSAMETVVSNFWSARGYAKWLRDFRDQQKYDNATLGQRYDPSRPTEGFANGRIGGVAPFSPAQETDTAWGIAAWLVPEWIAAYYEDERMIQQMYESCAWYMEHWIAVANSTGGWFSYDKYGDFGNTNTPAAEYVTGKTQYFYALALERTARYAAMVGNAEGSKRYTSLWAEAKAVYMEQLYNATSGCFGNCTYVNQVFGLSLPGSLPVGSPEAAAAWAHVLEALGPNASNAGNANRFGGGIVTLKLIYPLFQRFGEATLALRTLLHTDRSPSLGFMTAQQPSTTLHEAWDMSHAYTGEWVGSFNHVMMASPGRWFFTLFVGIDREHPSVPSSARSWSRLRLEPPRDPEFWEELSSCSGALDTPAGQVVVAWSRSGNGSAAGVVFTLEATVPTNTQATLVLPTVAKGNSVTIRENGTTVWTAGKFMPGVSGIATATAGADSRSVELGLGSGSFIFVVSDDGPQYEKWNAGSNQTVR